MHPAMLIRLYQRIPVRGPRTWWSFGQSTSHKALAAVLASATPWRTFFHWAIPSLREHWPDDY